MHPLTPTSRRQPWGSPTAIPHALGLEPDGRELAEAWFGAYPTAPSIVEAADGAATLSSFIAEDPAGVLGADVLARFGPRLPFVVKLIAADSPLSLQVHPDAGRAAAGWAAQQAAGVAADAPTRRLADPHGRSELIYALTAVEAVCGLRTPRRALELLDGLDAPVARRLAEVLRSTPGSTGPAAALRDLLDPETGPSGADVAALTRACAQRLWDGSPSVRADRAVVALGEEHPGDVGVVASLLMNSVGLAAGEAMFVPAGTVHAYLSGLAVEVLAASDNELRGGLTHKPTDPAGLLDALDQAVGAPLRIAPETFHGVTRVFRAPVEEFELAVTTVDDDVSHPLPARGPRVLVCLAGHVDVEGEAGGLTLGRGGGAFVAASDGPLRVSGRGTLVQASVP